MKKKKEKPLLIPLPKNNHCYHFSLHTLRFFFSDSVAAAHASMDLPLRLPPQIQMVTLEPCDFTFYHSHWVGGR